MQNHFPKIPLIVSILLLIISSCAFLFLYKKINDNNIQAQNSETEWQTEAFRREEIKTLNNSIQSIEDNQTQLDTHFAQSLDVVPFLNTVEGLAPSVGAKAQVVSVDIASDHSGLNVSLDVLGNFSAVYKFLTLLENSPYELQFTGMDVHLQTAPDLTGKTVPNPNWEGVLVIKLLSFTE